MLNIENNLILEYNYIDEGKFMKIIIYLESKEKLIYQLKDNYSLDIYKNLTKEALYYGEKEDKFITSDGGKVENINMKIMNAINSDLNKHNREYNTKFHLQKFKCIGKEKDILIYLVKFNDEVKLNNFIKLDENNILYKKTTKIIKEYKKKNKKSKNKAVKFAFRLNLRSFFVFAFNSIVLLNLLVNNVHSLIQNHLEKKPAFWLGVLVLFINLGLLISQLYLMHKEKKSDFEFNMAHSTIIAGKPKQEIYEKLKANPTDKYENFEPLKDNPDSFLICDEQNYHFQMNGNNLKVIKEKKNKTINTDSKNILAQFVGERLNSDTVLFNGDLLGIDTELLFDKIDKVFVKDVKYFNYISIDDAIYKNIIINSEKVDIIEGHKISLNPITGGLYDIKNSPLTNLIGVNLIVEVHTESDVYLLINRQSLYNDVNSNKFVPTSSGSLELADYNVMVKNNINSFGELLKIGMLRELVEECYIDIDFRKVKNVSTIEETYEGDQLKLLGFSRLINKAGKPDFFAKLVIKRKESELAELLDNFDIKQNEYILNTNYRTVGRMTHNIESNELVVVRKEEFIDKSLNINVDKNYSPQLSYIKYLLQKEEEYINKFGKNNKIN